MAMVSLASISKQKKETERNQWRESQDSLSSLLPEEATFLNYFEESQRPLNERTGI